MLGHTYAVNKQFGEAIAEAEKAVELSERAPGALGILGMVYGFAERKEEAKKILKELLTLNERRYVTRRRWRAGTSDWATRIKPSPGSKRLIGSDQTLLLISK